MYNLYTHIATNPGRCRRFVCGDSLLTIFNCRLQNQYVDLWSHHNYIVYVVEGRKIWHTSDGSYDLEAGSCMFVKKGACIVEQFFDTEFCFFLFFIPDDFIRDVLKSKVSPLSSSRVQQANVMKIDMNAAVHTFYQSMMVYFESEGEPDQSLLELKFRELILTIAGNEQNNDLLGYFQSMIQQPQAISLQQVMQDNFCFNLKLEEFARLSSRSLSAFKRDFVRLYHTTPGKWLLDKRLQHAHHLLSNLGKTVSEASFESGFENPSHFSRAFRQRFGVAPASLKYAVVVS